MTNISDRVECTELLGKLMPVEEAVKVVKNHDQIGISGFTKSGEPKAFIPALARHLEQTGAKTKIALFSGASLSEEVENPDRAVRRQARAVHVVLGLAQADPLRADGVHGRPPLDVRAQPHVRLLRRHRPGGGRGLADPAGRERDPVLVGRHLGRGADDGEEDRPRGQHGDPGLHRVPRHRGAGGAPARGLADPHHQRQATGSAPPTWRSTRARSWRSSNRTSPTTRSASSPPRRSTGRSPRT